MKSILKKIISSILIFESKIVLNKYKPTIIAVTGNVGKTSTKDAIFSVLADTDYVRKSQKSFNSDLGIPLTILGCENGWHDPSLWIKNILHGLELIMFKSDYPKCLVLEIGADHPGDIKSISKWLRVDIVVITKIGEVPVHIEAFSSVAELIKEKAYLIDSLKRDGTLILSVDDKEVGLLSNDVKQRCMSFGIKQMATVNASDPSVMYDDNKIPIGMSFKLNVQGNSILIKLRNILGIQQIYPIIAAITVGIASNIAIDKMIDSLENHKTPKGRMNIISGINGSIIIDDSYNSSPDALREGLNTLASLQVSGKRIAVLGDMLELGVYSRDEHKKAGIQAIQSCDILITVGHRSRAMSDTAINFDTASLAGEYVRGIVSAGDVVFIKGSQSIRMERVAKILLLEQDKASELLVRQEPEWLAKK